MVGASDQTRIRSVVIVEDEPPARAKLRRFLDAHAGYRIVAEAEDIAGALTAWRERPDLLFLDIQHVSIDGAWHAREPLIRLIDRMLGSSRRRLAWCSSVVAIQTPLMFL